MAAILALPATGKRTRDRGPVLPEKTPLTNRIGRHFARIKAAGLKRYQLWLLGKTERSA
jgi:hypothetical protein